MKSFILSLNPFVRGVAIMTVSYLFAEIHRIRTDNIENAISSFFLLTVLIYETLLLEPSKWSQSMLILFCRGIALAVGGVVVAFFFFRSGAGLYNVFGVAAMILAYEMAILPRREGR